MGRELEMGLSLLSVRCKDEEIYVFVFVCSPFGVFLSIEVVNPNVFVKFLEKNKVGGTNINKKISLTKMKGLRHLGDNFYQLKGDLLTPGTFSSSSIKINKGVLKRTLSQENRFS